MPRGHSLMRILVLTNFFPPFELGGYGQLCEEVVTALNARGHTLHVLTSNHGLGAHSAIPRNDTLHSQALHSAFDVTRTLCLQAAIDHYQPLNFLRTFQKDEAHNREQLRTAVAAFQPDIVFVWGMWNLSVALPQLAESLMPGRVAYYICSYWPTDEDLHLRYWNEPARGTLKPLLKLPLQRVAQEMLRNAGYEERLPENTNGGPPVDSTLQPPRLQFEHSACVSQFVRTELVDSGALPASARVIYNGGDLSAFYRNVETSESIRSEPLRLLYFGRLIADKGAHTALEALALLKQDGVEYELQLTILGDGRADYIESLHQYATEKTIDHLIAFHDGVPRDEVPAWLHRHDCFLFTSTWAEPLARSVMEAMMAGLLVIGAEVGGQTEMMVDGENALTFTAGDAQQLADQIRLAYSDPSLRFSLAKEGQQMVQTRFAQKRMIDEIEEWLHSLV